MGEAVQDEGSKAVAAVRCQPAKPVDVWRDETGNVPDIIITLAQKELDRVEEDIASAEIERDILQATIDNMTEVANQIKDFLRKAEGRQA